MEIKKLKFRAWMEAQEIQDWIVDAIKTSNYQKATELIIQYLAMFIDDDCSKLAWYETIDRYYQINQDNEISLDIPIFTNTNKKKSPKEAWDYPNRSWWIWAHSFAKQYGWTLEQSANLEVVDAFYMMQELMIDEQLDKEWAWGLTELAYPYNSTTKKSEFSPLPRPSWMKPKPTAPKKIKMPRNLLPMGIVLQGTDDERITVE